MNPHYVGISGAANGNAFANTPGRQKASMGFWDGNVAACRTWLLRTGQCRRGGRDYKIRADQQASITGTVKFGAKKVPLNALVTFFNADEAIAAVGFVEESGNFAIRPAEKETGNDLRSAA